MKDIQIYCEFCGEGSAGKTYGKGSNYTVLKCEKCSLLWSNPLTDDDYEKQINSDYFGEDIYIRKEKGQKERFRAQINKALKFFNGGKKREDIKVLDIGSGLGFFLDVCDEMGLYCEGCDINEKAVTYANKNKNRTRLGTIDSHYSDSSFDIIFALNLIEHIPHPKKFIEECRRVLKPGGLLILETPIQESLFHVFARVGDILTGFRMNNYGVNTNGHIYKFCGKTFKKISELGFETVHKEKIGSPLREIYGKTAYMSKRNKIVLRIFLPVIWFLARITNMENRIFIVLRSDKQN